MLKTSRGGGASALLYLDATGNYSDPASTNYKYLRADGTWAAPSSDWQFYDATGGWSTPELLILPQSSEELNLLTWEQCAQISAAAAVDPEPYLYMTDADHKLEKDIDLSAIELSSTVKARIIGIGQDVDENGNVLGITWQLCDGLSDDKPVEMRSVEAYYGNRKPWSSSYLRNTGLPAIKAAFPLDLSNALRMMKKVSLSRGTSGDETTTETVDDLVILSYVDVFGTDRSNYGDNSGWRNEFSLEGKQYQWYESHNNDHDRVMRNVEGNPYQWNLRTIVGSSGICSVTAEGKCNASSDTSKLPCACFSVQI